MTFAFILAAWIFSVCLHEFAHAVVAYAGGDKTVKDKGYLTLNPLKFVDPVTSIILPIAFLVLGGFGLPGGCVYIERQLLRSRAWDCAVSLAGPAANLILAVLLAAPFYLGYVDPASTSPVWQAYAFLVVLQFTAVLFNLIPVPPFDGFQAMAAWFDEEFRARVMAYSNYGFFAIFVLFWYVDPVSNAFWNAVFTAAAYLGVPPDMAIDGLNAFRLF